MGTYCVCLACVGGTQPICKQKFTKLITEIPDRSDDGRHGNARLSDMMRVSLGPTVGGFSAKSQILGPFRLSTNFSLRALQRHGEKVKARFRELAPSARGSPEVGLTQLHHRLLTHVMSVAPDYRTSCAYLYVAFKFLLFPSLSSVLPPLTLSRSA